MARVIKAGGGQKAARAPQRVMLDAGPKRLIGRELYQAKQDAEHILLRAEQRRAAMLAEGRRQAAQAQEEAMTRGASEAFAAAAAEALAAFRRRAERYAEAAEDIRALALEVVKKILGTDPDLGPKDVDVILSRGLAQLRARRRLRLQVSAERLASLAFERPNLMKAVGNEPDILVEAADDVGDGFARVVTEVGGALCAEDTAIDELARAVNVMETPRAGKVPAAAKPGAEADETTGRRAWQRDLPDARVVEENEDAGDIEATLNVARSKKPPRNDPSTDDGDEIEEIEADEDDSRTQARPPKRAAAPARSAPRQAAPASSSDADDEDLNLFTDEAVAPPKKRR